jgi:uncharacterized membrane protein (UPF0136 family)
MDTRGVGAIILKITGLVMIVTAVIQIPGYFPLTTRGYDLSFGETLGAAAVALGPLAIVGALLWFFPGTITNRIVSGAPASHGPIDFRPLELIALSVLGIYLLTGGLIGLVRDVVIVIVMSRQASGPDLIPASVVAHAAATIAELAIGATLCVGAKGISRMVERWRQ